MSIAKLIAFALVMPIMASPGNSLANPLKKLPEIANAREGMQLITRDAFGPLELDALSVEVTSGAVHERLFAVSTPAEGVSHSASLTENFGRISLGYFISAESDDSGAQEVFNLTHAEIIDYFSSLNVGQYLGNEKLNNIQREYRWRWVTGQFHCEITYNYWDHAAPYLYYTCESEN